MSEPTVHDAQVALVDAIEKRTWSAAASGSVVPSGAPVNEAIRTFHAAIEREAYEKVRAALTGHRNDLRWCNKTDNCNDGAEWFDLALDDLDTLMGDDDGR